MINKLKLAYARRKLENALLHEMNMRESMEYTRRVVIPKLEDELERAEMAALTDEFYADAGL